MILCVNGRADGTQREHEVSGKQLLLLARWHKSLVVQSHHRKWRSLAQEKAMWNRYVGQAASLDVSASLVCLASSGESSVDASVLAPGDAHIAKENATADWTKIVTKPKPL
jgi:hypothetical protein